MPVYLIVHVENIRQQMILVFISFYKKYSTASLIEGIQEMKFETIKKYNVFKSTETENG
jgi:hypothetical protein